MRKIVAKFEIEDNDVVEYQLEQQLKYLNCTDFYKVKDTEHLKEDKTFQKLKKAYTVAQNEYLKYIYKKK